MVGIHDYWKHSWDKDALKPSFYAFAIVVGSNFEKTATVLMVSEGYKGYPPLSTTSFHEDWLSKLFDI